VSRYRLIAVEGAIGAGKTPRAPLPPDITEKLRDKAQCEADLGAARSAVARNRHRR